MSKFITRVAQKVPGGKQAVDWRRSRIQKQKVEQFVSRLCAAGLVDLQWYQALSGMDFSNEAQAARHYISVGSEAGLSIHPLIEPRLFDPPARKNSKTDPAVSYLLDNKRVTSPHPLFDERVYRDAHPDAVNHVGRGLGHFLATATPDTKLPARQGVAPPSLGWEALRLTMIDAASRARRRAFLNRPRVSDNWDSVQEAKVVAMHGGIVESDELLVSIIMPVRNRPVLSVDAINSILAQTMANWELIVVDDGSTDDTPEVVQKISEADHRIRLIRRPPAGVSASRNYGIEQAQGRYIAFLDSDNTWNPRFLELVTNALRGSQALAAYAAIEQVWNSGTNYLGFDGGRDELLVGNHIPLITFVCDRELVQRIGSFDLTLKRWVDHDLVLRASRETEILYVPVLGAVVEQEPAHTDRITATQGEGWGFVVLNKHLIDWDRLRQDVPVRVQGRTSVLIPTFNDWRMTVAAVQAVLENSDGLDIEIVVVDNGSERAIANCLDAILTSVPRVTLLHEVRNRMFALGSNLAFASSTGDNVVFLNNDTEVRRGWLQPLLDELSNPHVAAAQPLLNYPDGTIQCAGVFFPGRGWLPSHFLAGHPTADAQELGTISTRAITGAAFAVRAVDVAELGGFDPIYINGWEDIDFCLRLLKKADYTHFAIPTMAEVEHHEGKTPGRGRYNVENREIFLSRWREAVQESDESLWQSAGFEVVGYDASMDEANPEVAAPRPVIARPRLSINEIAPQLRWAIRIAAHPGPRGDSWGDVFFAEDLAIALRRLGQQVVVDRRQAYSRSTSYLDNVTITLRGLDQVVPLPGRLDFLWVISHPDLVTSQEASRYARVYAASHVWAAKKSQEWTIRVDPLLQATDPTRFHPVESLSAARDDDVLFVGNFRQNRRILADAINAGVNVSLYGRGWRDTSLKEFVRADFIPNAELGSAYSRAGVVLCDQWRDMAEEGFAANRLFDAVASGARVVSEPVLGGEDVFGDLVHFYSDEADLRRVVGDDRDRAFLPDDVRRARAKEFTRAHSFDQRASVMLADAIAELRSRV